MDWTALFSGQPAPQAGPAQPTQQPQPQQQQQQQPVEPGFEQPADVDPNGSPQQAQSPLDQFKDLFNIEPEKDANGNPVQKPTGDEPFFNMDKDKFSQAVGDMNFIPETAKESLEAVMAGDLKQLPALLNAVARNGYMQQTQLSQSMMEDLGKNAMQRMRSNLPETLKNHSTESTVFGSNVQFNHPAVKPVVKALAGQVLKKWPNATPQEVQQKVTDLMKSMGSMFEDPEDTGGQQSPNHQGNQYDWSQVFGQ